MGNNPTLASNTSPSPTAPATPAVMSPDEMALKIKAVYEQFLNDVTKIKREHREKINVVLHTIDERKIEILKEKLKNM